MRHLLAAAFLLTFAVAACAERARGPGGAYVGGSVGGNVARDR
jgi:hypothetical protein